MDFLKATEAQHLQKAAHNWQLSSALKTLDGDYKAWEIITVFYAAVHLVQAYLRAKTTAYPQTHQERDELIVADPGLNAIHRQYRELKRLSVIARYFCLPTNDYDVGEARRQYTAIETHVLGLLKGSEASP